MKLVFETNLTAGECAKRLEDSIDTKWRPHVVDFVPFLFLFVKDGRHPVFGKVREGCFHLQERKWYHNSFSPVFYGEMVSEEEGQRTRIQGRFSMHWAVKGFLALCLGLVLLIGVGGSMSMIKRTGTGSSRLHQWVERTLVMILFGSAIVLVGKLLGRIEEAYVVDFIKKTLDATPVRYE